MVFRGNQVGLVSPVNEERIGTMRALIEKGEHLVLVVRANTAVVGFGSLLPAGCKLSTLYVHPHWGGRGVGKLLLQSLEQMAQKQSVPYLQLDASLNAEHFYHGRGYRVIARGVHVIGNGQEMNCVTMRKDLRVTVS